MSKPSIKSCSQDVNKDKSLCLIWFQTFTDKDKIKTHLLSASICVPSDLSISSSWLFVASATYWIEVCEFLCNLFNKNLAKEYTVNATEISWTSTVFYEVCTHFRGWEVCKATISCYNNQIFYYCFFLFFSRCLDLHKGSKIKILDLFLKGILATWKEKKNTLVI